MPSEGSLPKTSCGVLHMDAQGNPIPCPVDAEPKGSASSSPDERCIACGCTSSQHMGKPQGCLQHGFHAFVPAEPEHAHCPHWESDAEGDVCCECSKKMCEGCGDAAHGDDPCEAQGCLCGHDAPEPEALVCLHNHWDENYTRCRDCGFEPESVPEAQPPRRPPYAVAYVLEDGTAYEVALPGDATVRAHEGALIITHTSSPVAGLTQARPMDTP